MSKIKLKDYFYSIGSETISYDIPGCNILVNKQKRKTYGKKKNKIYLNNGDYIQIKLFNPRRERIAAQLELNGTKEKKILIIEPGQKVLLDRFVDTKKKIKFDTYFVDNKNKKVKKAIKNNGKLKIYFWTENNWKDYYYTGTGNSIVFGNSGSINYYDGSTTTYTSSINNSNIRDYQPTPKIKETGRINKGEKSKQKMKKTEFDIGYIFYTKTFKLLPFSEMKLKKKIQININ